MFSARVGGGAPVTLLVSEHQLEPSAEFANAVLAALRLIHWLLIALVVLVGLLAIVLLSSYRGMRGQLSIIENQQEQTQFQQRMEDLLTKGSALDAMFAATEMVAIRPRDPTVFWYLGQANFQLREYVKAKKAFSTVIEIAPNWTANVEPWLERVNDAIRDAGPKMVK
jgi:cytochrome c-type biogenesis protein CcmH/NrfG